FAASGIALRWRTDSPTVCADIPRRVSPRRDGAAAMPAAATTSPRIHEVPDDLLAAIDFCYEQGWTDGLPVVPPVVDRVNAMLAADGRAADTVVARHPATGLDLSLHAAAVNAVMAGCLPEYFPVLVAAFTAMDRPEFNFHGSTASTGGSAPLLVVSGPCADEIGM